MRRTFSTPRASFGMPSGTSLSSFDKAFVRSLMSALFENSTPSFVKIVLQQVSTSSLAVPIAKAGSTSTALSNRSISFCIQPASRASATVLARLTVRPALSLTCIGTNRGRPAIGSVSISLQPCNCSFSLKMLTKRSASSLSGLTTGCTISQRKRRKASVGPSCRRKRWSLNIQSSGQSSGLFTRCCQISPDAFLNRLSPDGRLSRSYKRCRNSTSSSCPAHHIFSIRNVSIIS